MNMKLPDNISELVIAAREKMSLGVTFGDLTKVIVAASLVLYPVISPNFSTAEKTTKNRASIAVGEGITLSEFVVLLSAYVWASIEYSVFKKIPTVVCSIVLLFWICPFKEIGKLIQQIGKGIEILGNVREQAQNILPYHSDLLPLAPDLLPFTPKLLFYADKLGPAMPAMMSQKEYILPVLPQLCEKLEILVPILPTLTKNIDKLAPHIDLLLPKLEILAPHVEELIPLWDDLESRLPILIEIDNLEPYLGETVPYMDRLIPMLDLLPMIHETGVLKYKIACDALPAVVRLLPEGGDVQSTYQKYQRMFLQKSSSLLAKTYFQGAKMLKSQESKLLEWRRDG